MNQRGSLPAKSVLFITSAPFPSNQASTRRIAGLAQTFEALGYRIRIASGQRERPPVESFPFVMEQWSIDSMSELWMPGASLLTKILSQISWGTKTLHWLESLEQKPDVIVIYGSFTAYVRKLSSWCSVNKIPLVADVVEWYQPSHHRLGWGGPHHLDCELAIRHYFPLALNIIAISRYLEKYFLGKGCNVIRVPPTLDTCAMTPRLEASHGPINLVYAGYAGNKDLIGNVISAIGRLDPEGKQLRLTLVGPKESDVFQMPAVRALRTDQLPPFLIVRGRLPHDVVINLVRDADFVPLLRKPQRYAMAGFPTKIPECMSLGTPALCNLTSDLVDHIRDGVEGLHCRDHSVDACIDTLQHAVSLTVAQRTAMRKAARLEAEKAFDFRVFVDPLSFFLYHLRIR
jgi:glycosyltransferase involved in cell wall biosynthesis